MSSNLAAQADGARIPPALFQAGASRFWLAVLCIGIGASHGREGAPKQAGAMVANLISDKAQLSDEQRRLPTNPDSNVSAFSDDVFAMAGIAVASNAASPINKPPTKPSCCFIVKSYHSIG